jgi:hypothetical protein
MTADTATADAFADGQREAHEAARRELAEVLGWDGFPAWTDLLVEVRRRPRQPWATIAAVTAERDAARTEAAALRRQVEELLALGVSIHKHADATVQHVLARLNARLCRAAADAHEEAKRAEPAGQRDRASVAADTYAEVATWLGAL